MATIKGFLKGQVYIPQGLVLSYSCLGLARDRFGYFEVPRCSSLQATPLLTALCCSVRDLHLILGKLLGTCGDQNRRVERRWPFIG